MTRKNIDDDGMLHLPIPKAFQNRKDKLAAGVDELSRQVDLMMETAAQDLEAVLLKWRKRAEVLESRGATLQTDVNAWIEELLRRADRAGDGAHGTSLEDLEGAAEEDLVGAENFLDDTHFTELIDGFRDARKNYAAERRELLADALADLKDEYLVPAPDDD